MIVNRDVAITRVLRHARRVLDAFLTGHHPTLDQLQALEGALFPFEAQKTCGHAIIEECDCAEVNAK